MTDQQVTTALDRPLGNELRAVGQAVEALALRDFTVLVDGADYVIQGWKADSGPLTGAVKSGPVQLRCTPEVIRRIDTAGRSRRSRSSEMPDPLSPSQILRVIGNSLASRQATLRRVDRHGDLVIIDFETESGAELREERFISSFYSTSVRMHLDRAERTG